MKAFGSSLSVALLASLAARRTTATVAEPTFVDFNYDIARSYAGNGVSFLPLDPNPVPAQHLMGLSANADSDYTACKVTNTNETSGNVTVLIAISKCLGEKAQTDIINWAQGLQKDQETFFKNFDQTARITYATAVVPGTCQAISEANTHGQSNMLMSSEEVLPGDMERFAAFRAIGRVLDALPTTTEVDKDTKKNTVVQNTVPIAVISFVDNYVSYKAVQQYELTEKISTTFNFKICEKGENCGGNFENCITLQEPVDVFMYSPFKVVSTFACANLANGIPVTYVDANNARKCACTRPAGKELSSDKKTCVDVAEDQCQCVWANALNGGYTVSIKTDTSDTSFSNLNQQGVLPAPIPVDNYVAKGRTNQNDGDKASLTLAGSPHIEIKTSRNCSPVYKLASSDKATPWDTEFSTTNKYAELTSGAKGALSASAVTCTPSPSVASYAWKDYQANRGGQIDKLVFNSYGKYELELFATDYNESATCPGCIAFVDKYRPQNLKSKCPTRFCDKSTSDCAEDEGIAELTKEYLNNANDLVTKFYAYQSTAKNNVCSSSERCDVETISTRTFSDGSYTPNGVSYKDGNTFFSLNNVKTDLLAKLTSQNPLKSKPSPRARDQWRVQALHQLGGDIEGAVDGLQRCEGSDSCAVKQCVAVMGDTIAVVTATIKSTVKSDSDKVVAELTQKGYNTETQIHVALACTAFVDNANPIAKVDPNCVYSTSVASLVDIAATANTNSILGDADMKSTVFWRYRVDTGAWKLWSDQTSFDFKKAETKVTIEAWTQCGLVRKFYFYVDLHLNNDIKVCDNFRSMWYQTTNPKLTAPDNFCTYPKSDFAEVTFDYHANIGLQYSPDKLLMNISSVVCRLNYDGLSAVEIVSGGDFNTPEIVKRFAVEAARKPTSALTKFHVTCDFMYKRYAPQAPLTQTCNQDFYITDCTGPEIDKPCLNTNDCLATDQCTKNNPTSLPAPYEACGGNIVSVKNGKSTFSSNQELKCCEFCPGNYQTTCKTLSSLPVGAAGDIKRCEPVSVKPPPSGVYSSGGTPSQYSLAAIDALQKATQDPTGAATVLLSASALVALVALVVVKRRRTGAANDSAKTMMEEDAYYPLLN